MYKPTIRERIVALIAFSIGPLITWWLFMNHDYICIGDVRMNPLCFCLCCIPIVITSPFLLWVFG